MRSGTRRQIDACDHPRRRAFTLIEVLVVVVVIGVLIAAIGLVGTHVIASQRVHATQSIMRTVTAAIDQFHTLNPLREIYDTKNSRTFGAFPPYQMQTTPDRAALSRKVEPLGSTSIAPSLTARLSRDMGGPLDVGSAWVKDVPESDSNNDIRALHAYLSLFAPDVLAQVPPSAIRRLPGDPEDGVLVYPGGPSAGGARDVFGIYDVWGVPLDYMLYVKLEYGLDRTGTSMEWRVTDRIPALRSRGVAAEAAAAGADTETDWIFSAEFPTPSLMRSRPDFKKDGRVTSSDSSQNGWARAKGEGETYGYAP